METEGNLKRPRSTKDEDDSSAEDSGQYLDDDYDWAEHYELLEDGEGYQPIKRLKSDSPFEFDLISTPLQANSEVQRVTESFTQTLFSDEPRHMEVCNNNNQQSAPQKPDDDNNNKKKETCVGISTININHFGKTSEKGAAKTQMIENIVKLNNDWLELIVVQEVNDPSVLSQFKGVELLSAGPIMRTVTVKGTFGTREVYPILAKQGSGWAVTKVWMHYAGQNDPVEWALGDEKNVLWRDRTEQGKVEEKIFTALGRRPTPTEKGKKSVKRDQFLNQEHNNLQTKLDKEEQQSDADKVLLALFKARKELEKKEDKKTRPIVAYKLVNDDGRTLNVSVVHTGPSGKEFARREVYAQVSTHLAWVNAKIGGNELDSQSWVVLGDFYLTSEADIKAEDDKTKKLGKEIWRPREQKDTFGALFPSEKLVAAEDHNSWEFQIVNVAATFPNLKLAMSVSATNWPTSHYRKGNVHKVQIADYMIVSTNFKSQAVGIFDLGDENGASVSGIWPVDPDHSQLKQWMSITDHVPIGGLLCTADKDPKVKELYYRAVNNRHPQDKRDYSDLKFDLEELNQVRADKGLPPLEKEDAFYYPPKAKG